jgi:tellurite resistance protein
MARFTQWIAKAVESLIDPDRNVRQQELVQRLHHGIVAQRQGFCLSAAIQGLDYRPSDLKTAKEQVYRHVLSRGWTDGKLTSEEQGIAAWVAERLEMVPDDVQRINVEHACSHFAGALAQAMEDGILEAPEENRLREIAASVGMSLPAFASRFFRQEGEGFLRSIFSACVADGQISQSDWDYLLWTTQRLGIGQQELLAAIHPQAQRFVEHVLADAKADGALTPQEDATLQWLLANLGLSGEFQTYVQQEVVVLRLLAEIAQCRLPSLSPPGGVEIRSGEIVHFYGGAMWREVRALKSGMRLSEHDGMLMLTDNRLVFSSPTKSQTLRYHKVVSHRGGYDRIEAQIEGKPSNTFLLDRQSPVPYAIFSTAVAMANQTRVLKAEGEPTRHIPRDVRQRVWQRYGGQCAECGATDYLEFDHIIPVAKGGSNTDSNVQLLCRRCNLKKSDAI